MSLSSLTLFSQLLNDSAKTISLQAFTMNFLKTVQPKILKKRIVDDLKQVKVYTILISLMGIIFKSLKKIRYIGVMIGVYESHSQRASDLVYQQCPSSRYYPILYCITESNLSESLNLSRPKPPEPHSPSDESLYE